MTRARENLTITYSPWGGYPASRFLLAIQDDCDEARIRDGQLERMQAPYYKRGSSDVLPTQAEAIERAREMNPGKAPLVERVRYTTGGKPDKWRKP